MSQVEKTTYTTSAILDRLVKLLNTDKYYNTVISFKWNPSGTFLFNPIDDSEINDIYLDEGEDFINYLKTAVVMVCNVASEPQGALIQRDLKIVLTPNQTIKFNEWSAKYLNTPISVKCQIIGALKEETYTKSAECYCLKCGHREKIIKNLIPSACENPDCSSRRIVIDDDTKIDGDIKTIIIQEPMEEVRHGAPMTKICVVKDDLVFDSFPGQRKMLTGVFKTEPIKGSSRNKILIHAISMQNLDDENLILPDDIELAEFQQMAKKSDYLEKVIESYAPHIKFRRLEKLAIICSRIGGQSVDGIRARIHSLLIGPPATAKSKLLEFLPQVTQRSGFAIGGMATGSSITVTMTTLPDRTKFPRGGIVVQCSGSGVALDELNQFPQEDQAKLYECQESGTIHYNKAGFDQLFMADTFIVAGANPKNGYYIESLGMVKNINLPAPMISRFDIIVNVLPEKSKDQSQQISNHTHLIKKIGLESYIKQNNLLTKNQLLRLFNFASTLKVTITDEAKEIIDDYVNTMLDLQNTGEQIEGAKQLDRRFIESVTRVAEALTRLHLKNNMTKDLAMLAIEYIKQTYETFGLKTDNGQTQISLEVKDQKDKNIAFDVAWNQMCKDAETNMLPKDDFCRFLYATYPKPFKSLEDVYIFFDKKHDKGDLIYEKGRYRYVA